jgi:hypothetical protein
MTKKASKAIAPPKPQRFPIWLALIIVAGAALIVVALIGSGANQSGATSQPEVSAGPALQVGQEKIDLGTVPLGETVSAQFEIANVGDQPLRFTQKPYIQVAAGC